MRTCFEKRKKERNISDSSSRSSSNNKTVYKPRNSDRSRKPGSNEGKISNKPAVLSFLNFFIPFINSVFVINPGLELAPSDND